MSVLLIFQHYLFRGWSRTSLHILHMYLLMFPILIYFQSYTNLLNISIYCIYPSIYSFIYLSIHLSIYLVWAKIGAYRWWPARVVPPEKLPNRIELLPHQEGEFPVQFLGSGDYAWINQVHFISFFFIFRVFFIFFRFSLTFFALVL